VRIPAWILCAAAASISAPAMAQDFVINTGGETGAYHGQFCPALRDRIKKAGFEATCQTSAGSTENMQRVADDPAQLGYGQLDVLALKARDFGGSSAFRRLRMDDVRECIFAVTREKGLDSYGELAVRADELRVILPPEQSGSAATYRFLQRIDPYGIGRTENVIHAANTDEAIRIALNSDDTVAFFVQFPDPDNPRFKLAREKGGHIVPVLDRKILDQRVDGIPVYFAQETQVENASWLSSGAKVVTACTPLIVFTGTAKSAAQQANWENHERMSQALEGLRGDQLMPKASLFSRVLRRTRELTATGAEKFVEISEHAREKAAPLFEEAREAARQAIEAGKDKPAAEELSAPVDAPDINEKPAGDP
jgi:hypothetical protein